MNAECCLEIADLHRNRVIAGILELAAGQSVHERDNIVANQTNFSPGKLLGRIRGPMIVCPAATREEQIRRTAGAEGMMVAHVADDVVLCDHQWEVCGSRTRVEHAWKRRRALDSGRDQEVGEPGQRQRTVVSDQVHHQRRVETSPVGLVGAEPDRTHRRSKKVGWLLRVKQSNDNVAFSWGRPEHISGRQRDRHRCRVVISAVCGDDAVVVRADHDWWKPWVSPCDEAHEVVKVRPPALVGKLESLIAVRHETDLGEPPAQVRASSGMRRGADHATLGQRDRAYVLTEEFITGKRQATSLPARFTVASVPPFWYRIANRTPMASRTPTRN